MTAITILNGDFEILFEDENGGGAAVAGMKTVRRTQTAAPTFYTTNALYSAVADAADDFQAMGFENPMLPVTPNAYTMENEYFIPRSSTEWLEEGAIAADWTITNGLGVIRKLHDNTGTPPAFVDIGLQVTEATSLHTGTLLDFEVEPDGTFSLWIRPDTAADTFASTTGLTTEAGQGGLMSVTGTAAATSGSTLYSSIQVIGSVPTATEVYLYQDRQKMTDSEGNFQWWATDTTVSLGIIDILIRVLNADISVADGDVEVFARRYTSLYDNFRLNVGAGGRSALPLASAPDTNNTTGYRTTGTMTGVGGVPFTVGNGVYQGGTWATATARGVITETNTNTDLEYYLVGDLTDLANTTAMKEYDFVTAADTTAVGTSATIGVNLTGPTDTTGGEGGTVTITLGNNFVDHDGDATVEPYSVTVDALGLVKAAKVYERIKYVTRRGSDSTFWAGIVPTDIPGETYRGLELQAQYAGGSPGAFDEGDNVQVVSSGYTARSLSVNLTETYVMLTDQQSSIKTLVAVDELEDEDTNAITITGTPVTIVSPKNSPFGTFTGSQIFGAQGVVYINPHSDDTQNYILIDDNGTQRTPPNTVSFTVNNTVIGDRILVARDTGTSGIIDKDQFGGLVDHTGSPGSIFNGLGDSVVEVVNPLDSEVAETGYLRIVETTLQEEHKYVYSARNLAAGTFTLTAIADATATTASSPVDGDNPYGVATLQVTGRDFVADGVEVGMLLRNTQAGKTTQVWEVTTVGAGSPLLADEIQVRQLYGNLTGSPAGQDIDIGDTFTINKLIGDHTVPTGYAATDNIFDLILDLEATGVTEFNTFVKTIISDFNVVVNVRQGKVILPFNQNPTVGDSGGSVTVVRTPDTIAT